MRGDTVFSHYWDNAAATAAAFDSNGFFRTGDTIALDAGSPPYFKILGRSSVDIIKSGGFKLSALQIEDALLRCPGVKEVAVVGLPDDTYGQVTRTG